MIENKPRCFGTDEYKIISSICKRCRAVSECIKVDPKRKRKRRRTNHVEQNIKV